MDKNFYTDLDYGKRGEKMVELALTAKGNKLIDVSDDIEYKKYDIDFVVERKRDTKRTGLGTEYKRGKMGGGRNNRDGDSEPGKGNYNEREKHEREKHERKKR